MPTEVLAQDFGRSDAQTGDLMLAWLALMAMGTSGDIQPVCQHFQHSRRGWTRAPLPPRRFTLVYGGSVSNTLMERAGMAARACSARIRYRRARPAGGRWVVALVMSGSSKGGWRWVAVRLRSAPCTSWTP
jgi:hypothetical protein